MTPDMSETTKPACGECGHSSRYHSVSSSQCYHPLTCACPGYRPWSTDDDDPNDTKGITTNGEQ